MTNMNELTSLADHASRQSDRWAFFAALIVLGVFIFFGFKYFLKMNEKLMTDHKESRDSHEKSITAHAQALREIVSESNEKGKELAVVLDRATKALDGNGEILLECKNELKMCRESR